MTKEKQKTAISRWGLSLFMIHGLEASYGMENVVAKESGFLTTMLQNFTQWCSADTQPTLDESVAVTIPEQPLSLSLNESAINSKILFHVINLTPQDFTVSIHFSDLNGTYEGGCTRSDKNTGITESENIDPKKDLIKAGNSLRTIYVNDCVTMRYIYDQKKHRGASSPVAITQKNKVNISRASICPAFKKGTVTYTPKKPSKGSSDTAYFLMPNTKWINDRDFIEMGGRDHGYETVMEIWVCHHFPDFQSLKYMLMEDEKSYFKYFPKELKELIVLRTLYREREDWKHEDTRWRVD